MDTSPPAKAAISLTIAHKTVATAAWLTVTLIVVATGFIRVLIISNNATVFGSCQHTQCVEIHVL